MSNTLYIDVSITDSTQKVDIELVDTEMVSVTVNEGGSGGDRLPDYTGDYTVTPKVTQVVLPTRNRSMNDDVTVFQIPYKEVANPSGGTTVTIGLE